MDQIDALQMIVVQFVILNLCENSSDDCSEETMMSIVDLYKSLFGKMKEYFHEHDTLGTININFSQIAIQDLMLLE